MTAGEASLGVGPWSFRAEAGDGGVCGSREGQGWGVLTRDHPGLDTILWWGWGVERPTPRGH